MDSVEYVEAMIHPTRDLAYQPISGRIQVVDFADSNVILRQTNNQGASSNVAQTQQ